MRLLRLVAAAFSVAFSAGSRPAAAFENVVRGATVDVSVATTPVGDTLMGELGGESAGLRSYGNRRWLLAWDVLVALRGGWLVAQRPALFLAGVRSIAWTELGVRAVASSVASPYLGVRISGDAAIMSSPGLSGSSVDGVGGIVARGFGRFDGGVSCLSRSLAFLAVGFVQEAFDAPGSYTPALAFTEGGLALRFDVARSFLAEVEGGAGVTANRLDAIRGRTDQTTRVAVSGDLRKIFANGMWLGLSGQYARDTDRIAYLKGATYSTGNAPTIGLSIFYGLPLWRVKR